MTVSFIHSGSPLMASYRYRAQMPSKELGLEMNDISASVLVFAKPMPYELEIAKREQARGAKIIVDFCDDHFDQAHYLEFALLADAVTCPTEGMAKRVPGRFPEVISDPYEFPEVAPHCSGGSLLWYGHGSNIKSLERVMRQLDDWPLFIVSNVPMSYPWAHEEMPEHFKNADIVVMPATEAYKSPNRTLEAIRQGCFVVAEPHPSISDIPGIWIGNLKEGIEWATQNLSEANQRTRLAQDYILRRYSPQTLAFAWKSLFERAKSPSTSVAASVYGPDGSTWTKLERTFMQTC